MSSCGAEKNLFFSGHSAIDASETSAGAAPGVNVGQPAPKAASAAQIGHRGVLFVGGIIHQKRKLSKMENFSRSGRSASASLCSDVTSAFWRNGASDRWGSCHATLPPSRGIGCHGTLIRSAVARPHTRARAPSSSTISAPSLSTRWVAEPYAFSRYTIQKLDAKIGEYD